MSLERNKQIKRKELARLAEDLFQRMNRYVNRSIADIAYPSQSAHLEPPVSHDGKIKPHQTEGSGEEDPLAEQAKRILEELL